MTLGRPLNGISSKNMSPETIIRQLAVFLENNHSRGFKALPQAELRPLQGILWHDHGPGLLAIDLDGQWLHELDVLQKDGLILN